MVEVDIKAALDTARNIVQEAHKEGKLQFLTARIVRKEVEQYLGLDDGVLENEGYKNEIKEFVRDFAAELSSKGRNGGPSSSAPKQEKLILREEVPERKRKSHDEPSVKKTEKPRRVSRSKKADTNLSSATPETDKPKSVKQSRITYKSQAVIEDEDDNLEDDLQVVQDAAKEMDVEKSKPVSKENKPPSPRKSKSNVMVIDDDDEEQGIIKESVGKPKNDKSSKSISKTKEKKPAVPRKRVKSKETVVEDEQVETPVKEPVKAKVSPKRPASSSEVSKPKTKKRKVDKEESSDAGPSVGLSHRGESDSELSELEDEAPKRRKKEKAAAKKPREKKVGKAKTTAELSPDEEQIKKLKSLIVACGVRKVWSKELSGLEMTGQQILHLRGILTGLGMTGRLSLEKARDIKAKRELAQELEDVQTFAQKHAGEKEDMVSRSNAKESDDHSDSEEEENTRAKPGRRKSAMKSIMVFLGDQSDSE